MAKYIGITIGPIFDMMSLVSTPAALWATSYMFSLIAKKTCEKLNNDYKIISPYYDPAEPVLNKKDGVGLFNDRIFIEADGTKLDEINKIKDNVLEDVSRSFGLDEDELTKRVLFIAAEIEIADGENLILKGGKILDSLELSRKVMFEEEGNPIIGKFTGALLSDIGDRRLSKNNAIKDIVLKSKGLDISPEKWILLNEEGKIKSLPDIANTVENSGKKKHTYYAIVRSDGDNMSKIIEKLDQVKDKPDLSLDEFSKTCLEYCSAVTEKVIEYKGMPVYSSGDDLLAIMPCDSGEKGTVFNFVKEVNGKFAKKFDKFIQMINDFNSTVKDEKDKIDVPSLSFGITICYNHFPLYEALEDSAYLLFELAKKDAGKNCTVVRLQKHSGQSEGLVIHNDFLEAFIDLQDKVLKKDTDTVNNILLSSLYKTEQFKDLFKQAKDEKTVVNLFNNTFDAPSHEENDFVHEVLPEFYFDIISKKKIVSLTETGIGDAENNIAVFNFALRILKFFVEKAGKEGGNKNE